MDLVREDLINYWYFWVLAVLIIGFIAFSAGMSAVLEKKAPTRCFLPMFCVELAVAAYSALCVNHWIKMGASFRWVIYEHAPKVYIAVIALICIPVGYLAGIASARREV